MESWKGREKAREGFWDERERGEVDGSCLGKDIIDEEGKSAWVSVFFTRVIDSNVFLSNLYYFGYNLAFIL